MASKLLGSLIKEDCSIFNNVGENYWEYLEISSDNETDEERALNNLFGIARHLKDHDKYYGIKMLRISSLMSKLLMLETDEGRFLEIKKLGVLMPLLCSELLRLLFFEEDKFIDDLSLYIPQGFNPPGHLVESFDDLGKLRHSTKEAIQSSMFMMLDQIQAMQKNKP